MIELIVASAPFFYLQFIASMTPGPNNVMLTASGMNFGYKRTIPHILGVMAGFTVLIVLCLFGVGALYKNFPQIEIVLKALGSLYLLYLAYKIATAGRVGLKDKAKEAARPFKFIEAVAFQFVNPKGVVFSITLIGLLPTDISLFQALLIVLTSTFITSACSTNTWALFGTVIAEIFRDDKARNVINIILAVLLLSTIPMMIF